MVLLPCKPRFSCQRWAFYAESGSKVWVVGWWQRGQFKDHRLSQLATAVVSGRLGGAVSHTHGVVITAPCLHCALPIG